MPLDVILHRKQCMLCHLNWTKIKKITNTGGVEELKEEPDDFYCIAKCILMDNPGPLSDVKIRFANGCYFTKIQESNAMTGRKAGMKLVMPRAEDLLMRYENENDTDFLNQQSNLVVYEWELDHHKPVSYFSSSITLTSPASSPSHSNMPKLNNAELTCGPNEELHAYESQAQLHFEFAQQAMLQLLRFQNSEPERKKIYLSSRKPLQSMFSSPAFKQEICSPNKSIVTCKLNKNESMMLENVELFPCDYHDSLTSTDSLSYHDSVCLREDSNNHILDEDGEPAYFQHIEMYYHKQQEELDHQIQRIERRGKDRLPIEENVGRFTDQNDTESCIPLTVKEETKAVTSSESSSCHTDIVENELPVANGGDISKPVEKEIDDIETISLKEEEESDDLIVIDGVGCGVIMPECKRLRVFFEDGTVMTLSTDCSNVEVSEPENNVFEAKNQSEALHSSLTSSGSKSGSRKIITTMYNLLKEKESGNLSTTVIPKSIKRKIKHMKEFLRKHKCQKANSK